MATKTTYCQCGAMIKLTIDNVKALDGALALWWREHQGEGHGPATRQQALAGRRRNEYHGRQERAAHSPEQITPLPDEWL